jgi:putative flippase GtrA
MTARRQVGRVLRSSAFRFLIQSGLSFGLNLGLTVGLTEGLGVREEAAFAIALFIVFVFNFVAGRYFVYRAREGDVGRQLMLFAVASFSFRGLEYMSFLVLHTWLGVLYPVAIVATLCVSVVVKYFTLKLVVFTQRPVAVTP